MNKINEWPAVKVCADALNYSRVVDYINRDDVKGTKWRKTSRSMTLMNIFIAQKGYKNLWPSIYFAKMNVNLQHNPDALKNCGKIIAIICSGINAEK